ALRQISEERREMSRNARLLISLAQVVDVLLARLLHDGEALPHFRGQKLERRRQGFRKEMRALASTEDEKEEARPWSRRRVSRIAIGKHRVAYRNAGQPRLGLGVGAKQLGRLE